STGASRHFARGCARTSAPSPRGRGPRVPARGDRPGWVRTGSPSEVAGSQFLRQFAAGRPAAGGGTVGVGDACRGTTLLGVRGTPISWRAAAQLYYAGDCPRFFRR